MWRQWLSLATCAWALGACNPYDRYTGDSNAGAVDPVKFPKAYLGTGGDAKAPGQGVMDPIPATAGGTATAYYTFPFTGADLSLATDGVNSAALVYDFDTDGTTHCVAPDNYVFDQQRDAVRFDQQGSIFTKLPDAADYQPAVAEVTVHSNGLPCQDVKSADKLVDRSDVSLTLVPPANPNLPSAAATGKPNGKYYARPVIDPSIDVHGPVGYFGLDDMGNPLVVDRNTGLGPQKWGWYQRYLLAYLDGGEIPVFDATVTPIGVALARTNILCRGAFGQTAMAYDLTRTE